MNQPTIKELREHANDGRMVTFAEHSKGSGEYTLISPYSSIPAVMHLQEQILQEWNHHTHFFHVCEEDDGEYLRGYIQMDFSLEPTPEVQAKICQFVKDSFEQWTDGNLDNDAYIERFALARRMLDAKDHPEA